MTAANGTMPEDISSLKRLEFVKSYASYATAAVEAAEKVYKTSRSFTPKFVEPYVVGVEDRVVAYAAPVVTAVQDKADKVLRNADHQIDSTVTQLWNSYEGGRSYVLEKASAATSTQAKFHANAKDTVFNVVDHAVAVLNNQRAALSSKANAATDAVRSAVELARNTTEQNTEAALQTLFVTWNHLLSFPAVVKILETSAPAVEVAKSYYQSVHGTVVANPGYKFVYNVSKGAVEYVAESTLVKRGEELLYPLVSPVAAPVLKAVTSSPLYHQVLQELKPLEAPKPIAAAS